MRWTAEVDVDPPSEPPPQPASAATATASSSTPLACFTFTSSSRRVGGTISRPPAGTTDRPTVDLRTCNAVPRTMRGLGARVRDRRRGPWVRYSCGMAYDEELASRVRSLVADEAALSEQRMFGGTGVPPRTATWPSPPAARAASSSGSTPTSRMPSASERLARPMEMRGRPLAGWLRVDADQRADGRRARGLGRACDDLRPLAAPEDLTQRGIDRPSIATAGRRRFDPCPVAGRPLELGTCAGERPGSRFPSARRTRASVTTSASSSSSGCSQPAGPRRWTCTSRPCRPSRPTSAPRRRRRS